jgi:hypothetical protein
MYNSVLNFPKIQVEGKEYFNIFLLDKNKTFEFIDNNPQMFYAKLILDDSKLEALAFKEYNDSSLWDMLLIINKLDSVFDLPKSPDYIHSKTESELSSWIGKFQINNEAIIKSKRQEIYNKNFALNEKHRNFKFLYLEYITVFLEGVRDVRKSA